MSSVRDFFCRSLALLLLCFDVVKTCIAAVRFCVSSCEEEEGWVGSGNFILGYFETVVRCMGIF